MAGDVVLVRRRPSMRRLVPRRTVPGVRRLCPRSMGYGEIPSATVGSPQSPSVRTVNTRVVRIVLYRNGWYAVMLTEGALGAPEGISP